MTILRIYVPKSTAIKGDSKRGPSSVQGRADYKGTHIPSTYDVSSNIPGHQHSGPTEELWPVHQCLLDMKGNPVLAIL